MTTVQDSGLEVLRKSAEVSDSSTYSIRVKLPTETEEATTESRLILYELKSDFELLNRRLAIIIKHLSLVTGLEIEE